MKFVFKSTINCHNCESKVAPFLDNEAGITSWEVDLEDPDRMLTVESDSLDEDDITMLVRKAGYKLELVSKED